MPEPFYALIAYEDSYVQPLIVDALQSQIDSDSYKSINSIDEIEDKTHAKLLQFRSYESIDFEFGLSTPGSLFNAYVIRKSLIRKHYLANTVFSWVTKYPQSILKNHFKPAVDFELDYAEFLDDALVEAFELNDAFARNASKDRADREWWILKPSMSDRGQGIRLFSTEEELQTIFERWEADLPSDSEDDEAQDAEKDLQQDYITTSHLRHFVAQPYIDCPLLFKNSPFDNRKFHIRTYVIAAGALRVYVYSHMLALFASEPYQPPSELPALLESEPQTDMEAELNCMRNVHLTNTCVQSDQKENDGTSEHVQNVFLLSSLPLTPDEFGSINSQIEQTTAEMFRAALALPTNFQPLPQSFEIFGVDFLVSRKGPANTQGDLSPLNVWLLEVNAFPDFAQTGETLKEVVVKGLFEDVFKTIISPHFGLGKANDAGSSTRLIKVLEVDMKR